MWQYSKYYSLNIYKQMIILIHGTPSYVTIYRSNKILKTVRFSFKSVYTYNV